MNDVIHSAVPALTALLVDDEALPRLHLRMLLEQQGVVIVGETENAGACLPLIEQERPDLLFLDIQMPVMTGMHLADALMGVARPPLVVFVTGYSEYAVEAFDRAAFDYLLKPTSPERLARTLLRARQMISSLANPTPPSLDVAPVATRSLTKLPIRTAYAVRFISVDKIGYIEARQKAVYLHRVASTSSSSNEEERVTYTLTQLENILPGNFLRVHDSFIVPVDQIEELVFLGNHGYAVRLNGGNTIPVGRTRYAALRERLGLEQTERNLSL